MKNNAQKFATVTLLLMAAALPAGAQSEISPDHFDDAPGTTVSVQASAQNDAMTQQMASEEAKLRGYEAQISEKERQVADDLKAAGSFPGDEAGQMIAYSVHQKECDQLKQALAQKIQETRETLASLRNGNTGMANARPPKQADASRQPMLIARAH
jgi:flagellar biosynthesis/type III secretory pathway protein FliH